MLRIPEAWRSDTFKHSMRALTELITSPPCNYGTMDEQTHREKTRKIRSLIDDLLQQYPDHPELLEERAVWEENPSRAVDYLLKAIASARKYGFPDFEIRLSLAEHLAEYFKRFDDAKRELDEIRKDIESSSDDHTLERFRWIEEVVCSHEGDRCDCGAILRNLAKPQCPYCGQLLY